LALRLLLALALAAVAAAGCARIWRSSAPAPATAGGAGGTVDPALPAFMRDWNHPAEPFRIIGNVYFVGTNELGVFLITTPAGHILIDSAFEESVPLIRASVSRLGFAFEDIKILLSSHAHVDHVGGHARVKELTGATVMATAPDAATIGRGGGGPLALAKWRPCVVDALLKDGDTIVLGGTVLTAHQTAGHTPGATTWTMKVDGGGRMLNVVFFSSATVLDQIRLKDNPAYPNIVYDFERSYAFWRKLPCDVFLAPHVGFFGLDEKRDRLARGASPNPFIDPEGWKRFIADQEKTFRTKLAAAGLGQ
jgi:metallo-beta-lactamase class B